MLLGCELLHSVSVSLLLCSEDKGYEFKNVPPFVNKTASLQAKPPENNFWNRSSTYLHAAHRHCSKEEILSL